MFRDLTVNDAPELVALLERVAPAPVVKDRHRLDNDEYHSSWFVDLHTSRTGYVFPVEVGLTWLNADGERKYASYVALDSSLDEQSICSLLLYAWMEDNDNVLTDTEKEELAALLRYEIVQWFPEFFSLSEVNG